MIFIPKPCPNKLKIGHLDYDIKWVGDDWIAESNRTGEINYVKQEIKIAETLKPEKLADTFLHEIIHAIITHFSRISTTPIARELISEYCAAGLVMVWRDNPAAFEWWSSLIVPPGASE